MTFDKAARFVEDNERERLRGLDMTDGGSRLYNWTIETQQNEKAEMARKKADKANTSKASELIAALQFVSLAGTKSDADYKRHVILNNKFAIASDGVITAGHPIAEELECCPQLEQLKTALSKCGASLSIAELPNGRLSVTGDRLTAKIECLSFNDFPVLAADPPVAVIDDRIKTAFGTCTVVTSESGTRAIECGLLLEANVCTATDGKILMQYWHGIDLPPALFVPHIFAAAVCKVKAPLSGFGWTQGKSVTFHFEGGAWIKTHLYEDKYPNVSRVIDLPSHPAPVPDHFFEAIETVSEIGEGFAVLHDGKIAVDNAEYEVEGVKAGCGYAGDLAKLIAPFVKTIDLTSYQDRAFFFGEQTRGVIMGCRVPMDERAEADAAADYAYTQSTAHDEVPF